MIVSKVTVKHPGPGTFQPDSWRHLVNQYVVGIPGLAGDHDHLCTAVEVAEGGSAATLTVHTEPRATVDLTRSIAAHYGPPVAHVRAHDADGTEIVAVRLDAPLQAGQQVYVNGALHTVTAVDWPHRDPATGGVTDPDQLDWQHVTLAPVPVTLPEAAQ